MQYVNLGSTGLKVSRICLGTAAYGSQSFEKYTLNESECRPMFERALDLGINFFDTADMYSRGLSEEITGKWLGEFASRDQVVIATKVCGRMDDGPNDEGLGRKHIMDAIDASLRRLGTDYVDLYQIHRFDAETPIEETMGALNDVVMAGKARFIGASSMFTYQFAKMQFAAERHGWTRFVSMQNLYNLLYREEEREMIPYCLEEGVGLIPWSPLARGVFARFRQPEDAAKTLRAQHDVGAREYLSQEADVAIAERVTELAAKREVTPIQIALAWMLHRPGITAPIIGATKVHYIDEAVAALDIALEEGEIEYLEQPYLPRPVMGFEPQGRNV